MAERRGSIRTVKGIELKNKHQLTYEKWWLGKHIETNLFKNYPKSEDMINGVVENVKYIEEKFKNVFQNMYYNLIIDDSRTIQMVYNVTGNSIYINLKWIIVKSFDEFVKTIIDKGVAENISFDHDLGDFILEDGELKERTGYDCAKWLINYCQDNNLKLPNCLVHSSNTVGSENISKYINNAKKHLNI